MTILYSIINPLKELSKASYSIPRGLASVERIDKILHTVNPITDKQGAVSIKEMQQGIEYRNLSFSYDGEKKVLSDINLTPGGSGQPLSGFPLLSAGKTCRARLRRYCQSRRMGPGAGQQPPPRRRLL